MIIVLPPGHWETLGCRTARAWRAKIATGHHLPDPHALTGWFVEQGQRLSVSLDKGRDKAMY